MVRTYVSVNEQDRNAETDRQTAGFFIHNPALVYRFKAGAVVMAPTPF
jgi:hypothetical protein